MIKASLPSGFTGIAAKLSRRAASKARAAVLTTRLARRDSTALWRQPALLWPFFTKG